MYFKLCSEQKNELQSQPETGMGYQVVKVILKNGKVLHGHKVLNSELLLLDENEKITINDIDKIKLFTEEAVVLIQKRFNNHSQLRLLTQLRDALLPPLSVVCV